MNKKTNAVKRIWLIGGTSESSQLACAIAQAQIPCTVTVTTESARSLYPDAPTLRVVVGCKDRKEIVEFVQVEGISAILDASHPYAVQVSQAAIAASTELNIPYTRYERPFVKQQSNTRSLIYLNSFDTLLAGEYLLGQRVLLTIGYRFLPLFRPWQMRSTLFARILPSVTALEASLAAGFTPARLLCIRPPISVQLEKALWQHWEISLVVTKASGSAGGEDVKQAVAAELGIPLIIISRPEVKYPQQTSDLITALEFCRYYGD